MAWARPPLPPSTCRRGKRSISVLGDGGFWHNGLTSSIGNAVFNKHDGVTLIVDNYYSAATGGQDILSSRALNPRRKTNNSIVDAVRGHRREMGAPDRSHLRRRRRCATRCARR